MASIKKIKTSTKLNIPKLNNYYKDIPNQNIIENTINKDEFIEKSLLEQLLKCDICNNIFDLNIHLPIIVKCGHTFCKKCIIEINDKTKKNKSKSCPLDKIKEALNIESCLINLRVELIIRKLLQKNPQKKQIIYIKPDIKKVNQNNINGEYGYKKIEESNANNKIDDINDNLNTPQIEEEINLNNKLLFEDEKVNGVIINETIDTIPLYDEKSFENVSFKEDVNELFEKKNFINNRPFLNENIKKELNKNKYIINYNNNNLKKNSKKNNNESNINKQIKPISKIVPNISLTPNKNKDYNEDLEEEENLYNYNYTDRLYNGKKYNLNTKKEKDIIIINKKEEDNESKNSNKNKQNKQSILPKKIILLNSIKDNKNNNDMEMNYNKLNTIQNLESSERKRKMNLILNKNANILSTQILKNSNNTNSNTKTIEAKNINYEQLIKSSNKRPKKIGRNYNSIDNDNEALVKNRTYNYKNDENNSILDLDNSNKYNKNSNELNKNIKILNKSNNNNSSSYSNSNSNSIYNKKKINSENNNTLKQETNVFHRLTVVNSKSQNLFSTETLKKVNNNTDINNNNILSSNSNSTLVLKKQKNMNQIIFSNKHFNKNEQKENIELNNNNINNNIRRANSFITNTKKLITPNISNLSTNKKINTIKEIKTSLENELNNILKENKTLNEQKSHEMLSEIFKDKKYLNEYDNIQIKLFENNDLFIGILENINNTIFPKKGIMLTHNGDYYNGEYIKGKKEGQGSIIYKNGTKYEGSFKNDFHDGYGKLIQLDGEIFEGEWKKGKINGKGMRIHSNGSKYIGSYINNIRNGQGHLILINGESYNGNFINGKANGLGTFKFKNGNIYYGEFKDNLIMGKGTLTLKNGDKYIGIFNNGYLNGKGTYINNNTGEKYVGNFEANKKNGEGKLYDINDNLIKEGIWENGIYIND